MSVKQNDIITQQAIEDVVRGYVEEDLVYRRPFEEMDISSIDNDTVTIPVEQDNMGEVQPIEPGSEFPQDEEDINTVTATVQKYGLEVSIDRESQQDSVFDVVARQVDKKARKMAEKLNELAYNEMTANLHPNSPAGGTGTSGTLEFSDIVDARQELLDDGYNPQFIVVNVQGEADLLNSQEFQRATDMGDETISGAIIGQVAGLEVVRSNAGLNTDTNGSGYVVDPTEYGHEVVKEDVATNQYSDQSKQAEKYQIWTRRTYKVTDDDAAIKVEG